MPSKNGIYVKCEHCGTPVYKAQWQLVYKEHFCGNECRWKHEKINAVKNNYISRLKGKVGSFKGKHHTEKSKKLLSLRSTGNKRCVGRWQTEAAKKSISDKNKARLSNPENHWNWQGGIQKVKRPRKTKEYYTWRSKVFERDNFICNICGIRGGYLEAHHIKAWSAFPELRFDVKNGMTVHKKCHPNIGKRKHHYVKLAI